jgi:hypothetical protein
MRFRGTRGRSGGLKALKIPPASKRHTDTTWRNFLRAQAATISASAEGRALIKKMPAVREAWLVATSGQTRDNSLSMAEKNELTYEVLSDAGLTRELLRACVPPA